jgi:hypothetical protein
MICPSVALVCRRTWYVIAIAEWVLSFLHTNGKVFGPLKIPVFGHKAYNTLSRSRRAIKVGRSNAEYSQGSGFGSRTMST